MSVFLARVYKITPKPNGLKKPVIIPKRNGTLRVATLRA